MTLTGPDIRVLQVHPTRFCNMRCVHCYSSSGPEERSRLAVPLLEETIGHAARLGYNMLSISGGEPLLYPGLQAICAEGRRQRMLVTLVTNGTAMNEARLGELAGLVDGVAISLDGAPARHNRMRRLPGAFQMMERRLPWLRRAAIPFGFVYTLTRNNLSELEWAADFAVAQGAATLQVHPIEEYGRALSGSELQSPPQQEIATACLVVECLRKIHEGKLIIQFDSLYRDALPAQPEEVARWKTGLDRGHRFLGEIVSPLVVEDDGMVSPLRYGFPHSLALGNLHERNLDEMAREWMRRRSGAFCDLYRKVLTRIRVSPDRFFNIYQMLAEEAAARSPLRLMAAG
jgi:MoaA/NifB/PqqE/SkfB family radical SAM enzyme